VTVGRLRQSGVTAKDRDAQSRRLRPAGVRDLLSRVPDWGIVGFFCGLILLQAIPSLRQESATYDEMVRQFPGYRHLTAGEYRLDTEHPPLIKMLAALPLLFLDVKVPPRPDVWGLKAYWQFQHDFLYVANDADRLVFLGRLAVLPLTLLLGVFVFRWSRELFGRGAATFAIFLYSFEPNILAHGRLMNTDLGAACFFFASIYAFARVVREVTLVRLVLAGLSLGLALVTKYSTLLAGPTLLLLGIAVVLSSRPMAQRLGGSAPTILTDRPRKLLLMLGTLVGVGLIAYVAIWGTYQFRYDGGTATGYQYVFFWEEVLPEGHAARAAILWAKEAKLLPEPYLHGVSIVLHWSQRPAFLMGEVSWEGWWYYFLVTFLLKTPLPLLLLLGLAIASLRKGWHTRGLEALFLLLPAFLYFAAASASKSDIGHRYVLPIYPFLFVLVSSLIPWAVRQRAWVKGGAALLAVWYLVSSLSIFPHYLAYFNELAGGPQNGYKYLVDSNLDWGQDLKGLKRYMDAHGIDRVWLSYFGTASPAYYGIAYNYLPSFYIFNPNTQDVRTPFVAISATNLQGVYFPVGLGLDADFFKEFRTRQPIAKIGYSIFLYRLP
jgi:4-amino-4-deoxy-L-arabinose transferase-like glycosyltransferase